jgi:hypothetical protein
VSLSPLRPLPPSRHYKCLKYKTDQKADVRKMEGLTMRLMDLMTSNKADAELGADAGDGSVV